MERTAIRRGNLVLRARPARDPHNPVLLVDVARVYALRFRFADAEKLVGLAETLYPDDARLQQMLGRSFAMLGQFDRAITCFDRALALEPATANRLPILLELARMHERLHNLEACATMCRRGARVSPGLRRGPVRVGHDRATCRRRWRR